MKSFLFLSLMLVAAVLPIRAQYPAVPQTISYQAVVRNSLNQPVVNGHVKIWVNLLQYNVNGPSVYGETHEVTTNANGLVTIQLGGGTYVSGVPTLAKCFSEGVGPLFIKTDIAIYDDPKYTVYNVSATSELLSVPYAIFAQGSEYAQVADSAANLPGGTKGQTLYHNGSTWQASSNLYNNGTRIGIGTTMPLSTLDIDGGNSEASLSIRNKNSQNSGLFFGIDMQSKTYLMNSELSYMLLGVNNMPVMFFSPDYRIGIGTSNPQGKFEIDENTDIFTPHLLLYENDNDYSRLMFKNSNESSKSWTVAGYSNAADDNSRLNFYYNNGTSGTDHLSITGDGEVQRPAKTGNADMLPLAYGMVSSSGTLVNGTSNVSCGFMMGEYYIAVNDVTMSESSVISVVTTVGGEVPVVSYIHYSQGILWVRFYNLNNDVWMTNGFSFVIYKP